MKDLDKEITPEMVKDAAHYSNWEQYKLVHRKELSQIEREARISELKRMWDENTNLCVLDKDDTVATLTLKLGKTNQIIAKRIKELESE